MLMFLNSALSLVPYPGTYAAVQSNYLDARSYRYRVYQQGHALLSLYLSPEPLSATSYRACALHYPRRKRMCSCQDKSRVHILKPSSEIGLPNPDEGLLLLEKTGLVESR